MARYTGAAIDTDIHHELVVDADYLDYFPERSRAYAQAAARQRVSFSKLGRGHFTKQLFGGENYVSGSEAQDGGRPGSSYERLRDMLLDPFDIHRGLLTHDVGEFGGHLNPYFAQDLCRAANDSTIDRWLSLDDRLVSGIVAGPQMMDEAVAEIHRLADHPKMACILMAGHTLAQPYGHPLHHPIFAAAAEVGLPIVHHVSASDFSHMKAPGGTPSTSQETAGTYTLTGAHIITSYIVHGAFEKFPTLRVHLNEFNLSWLPALMWNLERDYDLLRLESPWVKKRPTEYLHDHITLSTQPLEASNIKEGRRLVQLLESVEGIEDVLCFSSDFPHATTDDITFIGRILPTEWHEKVFVGNSSRMFGWPPPTGIHSRRAEAGTA